MEWTADCKVLNISIAFVSQILSKINNFKIFFHVLISNIANPWWYSRWKQANLQFFSLLFSNYAQDFFNVLLKSKFKHLISFIKNNRFNITEIDISSFNMIKDSTSSANKNLNTFLKFSSLAVNWDTSVNS